MNKAENRKPTYSLTSVEQIFMNLVKNKIYKDNHHFSKSMIRFKSKFILDNLEVFEEKIENMILSDMKEEDIQKLLGTKDEMKTRQFTKFIKQIDEGESGKSLTSQLEFTQKEEKKVKKRLDILKKKLNKNKKRKKLSDINMLESIEAKTGQFKKGLDYIEGYNIFSDLNYGDFLIVFENPFDEFMFEEQEANLKKIQILKRRKKQSEKAGGNLSKSQVEKKRNAEEKAFNESTKRMEDARKVAMESLGFDFEGDYKEIMFELRKKTKQKFPVYESGKDFNKPGTDKYGCNPIGDKFMMTLGEAFSIYDENLNQVSDILTLDKDYLRDEEIAFKNALIFHAKKFYEISYEITNDYHEKIQNHYFSTKFSQKPFTNYFFPLMENMFSNVENPLTVFNRYNFSFLYDIDPHFMQEVKDMKVDRRFFQNIMREVMSIKINQIGMHTRQFYSEDLKKIFLVIKCQDNVLKIRAEQEMYSMQIELGYTDLFSLEPVDTRNRKFSDKATNFIEFIKARNQQKVEEGMDVDLNNPDDESKSASDFPGNDFNVVPRGSSFGPLIQVITKIQGMTDIAFKGHLSHQKKTIAQIFRHTHNFLNYPSESTVGIIQDNLSKRKEWEPYYVYVSALEFWRKNLESLINHLKRSTGENISGNKKKDMDDRKAVGPVTNIYRFFSGLVWRLIYMKSIGDTNEAYNEYNRGCLAKCFGCKKYHKRNIKRKKLKSIWDKQNFPPMAPYLPYTTSKALANKWRFYEINELKNRDIFRSMDRIKLVNSMLTQSMNIFKLADPKYGIINSFGALHDIFEFDNIPKLPLFAKLPLVTEGSDVPDYLEKILTFMSSLNDEAEDRDFIDVPFSENTKVPFFSPSELDIDPIQNYFGEKIALYFTYLQNFAASLKAFGIFGVLIFIVDQILLYKGNLELVMGEDLNHWMEWYHYVRIIFTLFIVIWTTLFLEYWKRKEKNFGIRYGQLDYEEKEQERPGFNGIFKRDLANSSMNVLVYSKTKRQFKMLFGGLISFIIILLSVAATLLIMYFKTWMLENGVSPTYANIIAPLLNFVSAKLFTLLYDSISKKLNNYENHKSITQFEDSLVYKIFLFNIFNNFNSFIVLAFVKIQTEDFGKCIPHESNFTVLGNRGANQVCYNELISYVQTFFITGFVLNFLELIIPAITKFLNSNDFLLKRDYDWGEIDSVIEKEWQKESFQITVEVDGVLGEYLEITLLFSFISMFGQIFPLGFTFAFLIMCCELYIDKYKLIHYIKRPIPKGASDIGSWAIVLEIVSYVSIIVNIGILTFTSGTVDLVLDKILFSETVSEEEFENMRYLVFSILVCFLILIKKTCMALIPDVPRETTQVLQRHEIIKRKMKFVGSGNRPLFRAAPSVGKWSKGDFNMVSNPDVIFNKEHQQRAEEEKQRRKEAEIRPTYELTEAETMFVNLVDNLKYRDHKGLKKQVIKMKSQFILDNLDRFEEQLIEIITNDYNNGHSGSSSSEGEEGNMATSGNKNMNSLRKDKDIKSKDSQTSVKKKKTVTRAKLRKKLQKASKTKKKRKNYNIQFIEGPTGQFMKGNEDDEQNIFTDLNYGDFVINFHNPFIDFQFEDRFNIEDKLHFLKALKKRRKGGNGKLSKNEIEKIRMVDEKRKFAQNIKRSVSKSQITSSLGFTPKIGSVEDYEISSRNINTKRSMASPQASRGRGANQGFKSFKKMITWKKTPRKEEFNDYRSSHYGRAGTASDYEMTLNEANLLYNNSMMNVTRINSLDKDYQRNEAIAFKNALLFYSKRNYIRPYQPPKDDNKNKFEYLIYHKVDFDQKPHTYHVYPLIERMFMEKEYYWELFTEDDVGHRFFTEVSNEEKLKSIRRYKFTFLYDTNKNFEKLSSQIVIDRRFVSDLIRRLMALKLNKIGMHIRQFYSEDMKNIFMVMKCQSNILRTRAETEGYSMQIELGYTDLFSLEPVDQDLRKFSDKDPIYEEFVELRLKELEEEGEDIIVEKGAEKLHRDANQNIQKTEKIENIHNIIPNSDEVVPLIANIRKISGMLDHKFYQHLLFQKKSICKVFPKLKRFFNYTSKFNSSIINDRMVNRKEWERYYLYIALIHFWKKNLYGLIGGLLLKEHKHKQLELGNVKKEIRGLMDIKNIGELKNGGPVFQTYQKFSGMLWRMIFMKAIGNVNEAYLIKNRGFLTNLFGCKKYNKRSFSQKRLKTIWDRNNVQPLPGYLPYDTSDRMKNKWRYYEINELKERDIFRSMDRIKLTYSMLTESINIFTLSNPKYKCIDSFGALHDNFELSNQSKLHLYEHLPKIRASIKQPRHKTHIFNFMSSLSDEAEDRDFIEESVKDLTKISWFKAHKLNINAIQNYYGEKIALYFLFLTKMTKSVKFLAVLGLIIGIVDYWLLFRSNKAKVGLLEIDAFMELYHYTRIVFTFIIIIWATVFLEYWKRSETFFSIKYGQLGVKKSHIERPNFVGTYVRDLGSSKLNVLHYSHSKRNIKKIISFILSSLLVIISLFFNLLIIAFRGYMIKQNTSQILSSFVPPTLQFISIRIFGMVYGQISKYLNNYENHKNLVQFENSLNYKIFLFNIINTFIPFIVISFIKTETDILGECLISLKLFSASSVRGEELTCFNELNLYVFTFFFSTFAVNFMQILVPKVNQFLNRNKLLLKRKYGWGLVDKSIEHEWLLEPYQVTLEIDGVLQEYLEIVMLFGFLSMFGQVFPAGFFIALIILRNEILIDKYKLLNQTRRPIPIAVSNIGSWTNIIGIVAYSSIIVNVRILVYSSQSLDVVAVKLFKRDDLFESEDSLQLYRLFTFAFLVSFFMIIRKVIEIAIPDIPRSMTQLLKRQHRLKERFTKKQNINKPMSRTGFLVPKWKQEELDFLGKGEQTDLDKQITFRTKQIRYLARAQRARDELALHVNKIFHTNMVEITHVKERGDDSSSTRLDSFSFFDSPKKKKSFKPVQNIGDTDIKLSMARLEGDQPVDLRIRTTTNSKTISSKQNTFQQCLPSGNKKYQQLNIK